MTAKFYHAGSLVKATYSLCLLNMASLTTNCYPVSHMAIYFPSKKQVVCVWLVPQYSMLYTYIVVCFSSFNPTYIVHRRLIATTYVKSSLH